MMAITEKECACGCGQKFYGTKRRVYFNPACKMRQLRRDKKKEESCL